MRSRRGHRPRPTSRRLMSAPLGWTGRQTLGQSSAKCQGLFSAEIFEHGQAAGPCLRVATEAVVGDDCPRLRKSMRRYAVVRVAWDDEAKVWYVEKSDIDGLATEADTLEELRRKVPIIIQDLL